MYTCRICQEQAVSVDQGVCVRCMDQRGAVPLPPARRPPLPCIRCTGMQFVRVVPRELRLAHPNTFEIAKVHSVAAIIEAYVCTKCGFIDWYCQEPNQIPIGPEHMAELVDYASKEPYR
jgi:hypothetical protein